MGLISGLFGSEFYGSADSNCDDLKCQLDTDNIIDHNICKRRNRQDLELEANDVLDSRTPTFYDCEGGEDSRLGGYVRFITLHIRFLFWGEVLVLFKRKENPSLLYSTEN